MPAWTKEERQLLRELYIKWTPLKEIGKRLGRKWAAVGMIALKMGLPKLRGGRWSAEDDRILREMYGKATAQEIANRLKKTYSAVTQRARKLDLRGITGKLGSRDFFVRIRELNGQGMSDNEIGRLLGQSRNTIRRYRMELGLPLRGYNDRSRARVSKARKDHLERRPEQSILVQRRDAAERYAVKSGWPKDTPRRQVAILNVLAAVGVPMTKSELIEAIRIKASNANCFVSLVALVKKSMVTRIQKSRRVGKSWYDTYTLSMLALNILEENQCQKNE